MSSKRKVTLGSEEGPNARERKKQKVADARTIAVQRAAPVNAVAGPSGLGNSNIDSMKRLPGAIDVEKFAEARAFEMDAMQTAMKTAQSSATQRAWQVLPRHLRRRAASHDVRRVPLRLREKARLEMDPVKKKALIRAMPKRGKDKRVKRTESFLKRQRDKTWLETHIWHAKRMNMENLWGYQLAVKPTEKAFRPSHRASVHGSIIHDASYYSLIELKGEENILKSILDACCDPQDPSPGAKRYSTGARACDTHIYKWTAYPFDLIAPITIIWKPLNSTAPSSPQPEPEPAPQTEASQPEAPATEEPSKTPSSSKKRPRKGTRKSNQAAPASIDLSENETRTVWVRAHPAVFEEVFSTLQTSASHNLEAARRADTNNQSKDIEVEIADLRGQVNVFEIVGPKSNQVIKGALDPIPQDERAGFRSFWASLKDLQTSGSVPRGMVIGFKVNDPRLKFPPKNAKPAAEVNLSPITLPSSTLAECEIWDDPTRTKLRKPRYQKKELDDRRAKNLIPGTALKPQRLDDRIPVLLIQRSIENEASSDSGGLHGWTLIVPAGWAMPFFSSLTFTGTRIGGQRERQTQAFESGTTYFPRDYPSTATYLDYAEKRETEEKFTWQRKPPAKRPNYKKLGTRSPWRADWEVVLGIQPVTTEESPEDLVTTQREEDPEMDIDETAVRTWLLRGSETSAILSSMLKMFNHGVGLLGEINRLRSKRGTTPLDASLKDDFLQGALVNVKVTMCARGAPKDLAVIYAVPDYEARRWMKVYRQGKSSTKSPSEEETPEEVQLSELVPSPQQIVGYVTTGNFSLSRGEGFAIGAIPVVRFLELHQQAERLSPTTTKSSLLVKIRDRGGQRCRPAHVELWDR